MVAAIACRSGMLAMLASFAIACSGPAPARSPTGSPLALPLDAWTPPRMPGQSVLCAVAAIDATIHGGALDPATVWLVDTGSGQRLDAFWPDGYAARFDPQLAVIDNSGTIVLREGDRVTRACSIGSIHGYWLDPPFQQ